MEEHTEQNLTAKLIASSAEHKEIDVMAPELVMVLATWFFFLVLFISLSKIAWKPILSVLHRREKTIAQSIDDAETLRLEKADIERTRQKVLQQAESESKQLIEKAKKIAQESARLIELKAKEQAQITLENTKRDVEAEVRKAKAYLKEETADIVVRLSERLMRDELDPVKQKHLIETLIKEM